MRNLTRYRIAVIWLCFLALLAASRQIIASNILGDFVRDSKKVIFAPDPTVPPSPRCAAARKATLERSLHTNLPVGAILFLEAGVTEAYDCVIEPSTITTLSAGLFAPIAFVLSYG